MVTDRNIRKKENERLVKYEGLKEEMEKLWSVKTAVMPIVMGHWEL